MPKGLDGDRIEQLRLQIELVRELFLAERARAETVRSSLGIPLAALTFVAFGFGSLAANAVIPDHALGMRLGRVAGILALLALIAFLAGLWTLFRLVRLSFVSNTADPDVDRFTENAALNAEWLADNDPDDEDQAEQQGLEIALEDLSVSYATRYRDLYEENRVKLAEQGRALGLLILGLALLILAVFASYLMRVAG